MLYAAQSNASIDAEIAGNGGFRTETKSAHSTKNKEPWKQWKSTVNRHSVYGIGRTSTKA